MERVTVLSDTQQEFMGERFYLCGHYYQHKGKRLHRTVWEAYNGDIPEGYHVHHIDEDRSNNQIENLSLMPGLEHMKMHAVEPERRENGRRAIVLAIAAAPEWHHSEEGKQWHSQMAKAHWDALPWREYKCDFCGKTVRTKSIRQKGPHFCNQNCKAKYARRKKAGLL